jgi:hypothetical protein
MIGAGAAIAACAGMIGAAGFCSHVVNNTPAAAPTITSAPTGLLWWTIRFDIWQVPLKRFEFASDTERKAETADFEKTQSADSPSADIEHGRFQMRRGIAPPQSLWHGLRSNANDYLHS